MKKFGNYAVRLMVLFLAMLPFAFGTPGMAQYLTEWKNTVFLEAEGFTDCGGWTIDQQYMDQMGSPVLLAHGWGNPVADAKTKVVFPKKGTYRLYVRTRNWVSPWTTKYAPGTFRVLLDGTPVKTVFGTTSDPWFWQQGDNITISRDKQEVEIALHDETGFDGRVDAICFTADTGFVPPNDLKQLQPLRRQAQNVPDSIELASKEPFDLVVVGGGIPGTCAAITAARLGLKVALVQNRPVLGGNNSSEVRVHLNGKVNREPYPNLGNLTYLMGPHGGGNAREAAHYKDDQRAELVAAEKNIQLFLCTHVIKADTKIEGGKKLISSVVGQNIKTGKLLRFEGKLFSDCTGDAAVGFLAGADWHMGRESRSETGESLAPEKKDEMTMGASVQWNTVEDKKNNVFPELPWAIVFNEKTIRPMVHGDWDWEAGMNLDQINDTERIRDLGLRAAYGHWSYMKNKMTGPWAEKAKDLKLGWVSFYAGKRESRRLMGDVVLKQQNLVGRTQWDDACVTTTWPIDLHYPEEENAKNFPNETFRSVAKFVAIDQYAIPYRCLYSRNINNLFMAGRDISVTHVALGTIRVMRTGGMMGEVVGMAAAVARKNNCLPRGVYEKHLDELKAHMKKGIAPAPKAVQLLRRPAWLDKPGENFALKAKVSVSGVLETGGYAADFVNDGKVDVRSNIGRWVSNRPKPSKANKNHWVTLTFDEPRTINAIHILSGMAINKPGKAPGSPINDFVLAYEKDGRFVDLPDTFVQDNQSSSIAIKFPAVKSKSFRLIIFNTPGDIARIWEIELFRVDD